MVLSRYVVDGELILRLTHCGQLTPCHLLFSGNNRWFSGASPGPPIQLKYTGCLPIVTQAAAWTVNVSFALSSLTHFQVQRKFQRLLGSDGSEGSKKDGETAMKTLKRLGHGKLKLNEYESQFR
jgi:hypothetical protein